MNHKKICSTWRQLENKKTFKDGSKIVKHKKWQFVKQRELIPYINARKEVAPGTKKGRQTSIRVLQLYVVHTDNLARLLYKQQS